MQEEICQKNVLMGYVFFLNIRISNFNIELKDANTTSMWIYVTFKQCKDILKFHHLVSCKLVFYQTTKYTLCGFKVKPLHFYFEFQIKKRVKQHLCHNVVLNQVWREDGMCSVQAVFTVSLLPTVFQAYFILSQRWFFLFVCHFFVFFFF